jgi:hypothetical protein
MLRSRSLSAFCFTITDVSLTEAVVQLGLARSYTSKAGLWFADGLNFACTGCGKCCHKPVQQQVQLNDGEQTAIARYLGTDAVTVRERFLITG